MAALKTLDQLKDKLETKEEKGDKANMGGKAITALSVVAAGIIFFLRPKTYVVRKGDTLSSVSIPFHFPWKREEEEEEDLGTEKCVLYC